MKCRMLAALGLAVSVATNSWAATAGSVVIVLDCSKSMADPARPDGPLKEVAEVSDQADSRLAAALRLARRLLDEAAHEPDIHAGLWLCGHRLVWEEGTKQPNLLEQDAYLQASVGYAALSGLLPGDDVERALPVRKLSPADVEGLAPRLAALQPWGERPLYLTIVRALDDLANEPANATRCIVVLTDGGNHQWLARFKTSQQAALAALDRNLAPVHVIHFGPEPQASADAAAEAELRQLAEHAGGSLRHVTAGAADVTLAALLEPAKPAPSPNQLTSTPTGAATAAPGEAGSPTASPTPQTPKIAEQSIAGSILYFGKPVSSATIAISGTDIPPAKTDRNGRFILRRVPTGKSYQLEIQAVAKNKYRDRTVDFTLHENAQFPPFLNIDLKD